MSNKWREYNRRETPVDQLCLWCNRPLPIVSLSGRPKLYCNKECARMYQRKIKGTLKHCKYCGNLLPDGRYKKDFCEDCRSKDEQAATDQLMYLLLD
jgi:hypothetical protein